jgi:hypothetical protein
LYAHKRGNDKHLENGSIPDAVRLFAGVQLGLQLAGLYNQRRPHSSLGRRIRMLTSSRSTAGCETSV